MTSRVELPWHRGPLASYDCETTGLNTDTDRIVTAALVRPNGETLRWISDADGMEVPTAASDIHRYTTDRIRAHGSPAKQVIEEIADALAGELSAGHAALVVMNAPFDLPILNAECARHGAPTVADRIGGPIGPVIDPLVLDRAADRYRPGRRNLKTLAAHYGVELADAHQSDADAEAALGVALALAERYEELQVPARELHAWQVVWHERWAAGFEAHLRKRKPDAVVDRGWPLRAVTGGGC
ncbi:exonuclease domain-containing protein [Streptomyces sp. bgisy154]|uniref:exonuclease domain-containing protein n=1 Tax=Streptomyces sp. bgisy154 TaxID=3413794 RepID=UPI003D747051